MADVPKGQGVSPDNPIENEESGNGSLAMEGSGILDEISGVSGGKAFFPRSDAEMDDIFEQIALELRHQYSIGYRPPNFDNDGKWHRIKVKAAPARGLPRLFVRSKEGYFAIWKCMISTFGQSVRA